MADLYVSLLGRPFRAAIAFANGRRAYVKIGERRDDEFGLDPDVWIDREGGIAGAQAAYVARSGQEGDFFRVDVRSPVTEEQAAGDWGMRELLGIVLRRFLSAAEAQAGEASTRVVLVLPPAASAECAAICTQAAMLAGALEVETLTLEACFPHDGTAQAEALVETWDDVSRVTVVDAGGSRTIEVSAELAPERVRALLAASYALPAETDAGIRASIECELFERWSSATAPAKAADVARAAGRSGPVGVYVSARTFASLDAELARMLGDAFARLGVPLERLGPVRVAGSWMRPVARALRTLVPAAVVRDDRGIELDAAVRQRPPSAAARTPRLRGDLLATARAERTLRGISQGNPIPLLAAGTRLPASAVFEDFASSNFIESFWVAARDADATTPMLQFAIPRYAERQQNSYLRAVVHGDTADLMLIECAYLYPSRRRFAFFDRARGCEVPLSERAFRIVRG